ncbi:MAG: aminotransferase class V-fold PLP-dependent enzyme [Gemmatimonadales bacterium]|jgi:selenocysteine lyase/cysteine desulfurase|nr:MAG: aminotransferase class V-fold PLP-dependent enzyme [Gemmatimonadales bacterium]
MSDWPLPRRRFLRALSGSLAGAALVSPLEARAAELVEVTGRLEGIRDRRAWREALRAEYLLSPEVLYVNHASIGTIPRRVHEARVELLRMCEENPWLHMWGGAWEGAREDARAAVAGFLGTTAEGVALTHNTTEGFNLLANGLPLAAGDEVVFTSLNHDGASVAWHHNARRRGFAVRRVSFPLRDAASLSREDVVQLHRDTLSPRTRVLVLPHVDNMVGIRHDVAAIATAARDAGVEFVVVDAAQSAGMIPVAVDGLGVDAYAGSPHKWLQSAKGIGFAYLSSRIQASLEPMWVTWGQARWAGTVRRFEDYGTRNLAETVNLADAVAFQQGLRGEFAERGYRQIRGWMRDRVDGSPRLSWHSPPRWEDGASLVAIGVRGRSAPEVGEWLWREHRVVLRAFGDPLNALRVSPHLITTQEELERLFRLMEEAAT